MPSLEVADIFRRYGEAYRQVHAGHLGRTERRIMSAIEACRTARLGGHIDVWQSTKSTVAKAALERIAQFYAIEDKARFAPPDKRLGHRTAIIPLLDAFFTWAQTAERKLSARSELAEALRYIIKRAPR
jgi:hypothetical protein